MFEGLCKIGALIKAKFSWKRSNSPSQKASSKSHNGHTGATTGNNSPVHFGDIIQYHLPPQNDEEKRFKNALIAVAYELPHNFRYRGNFQNPFTIKALEKLVHEESRIQQHPELHKKASACLLTAITLSTSHPYHPKLKPADGQFLMKELSHYLFEKYGIKPPDPEGN